MVIGYISLSTDSDRHTQEWLRHALSKWMAEHDATLAVTCLLTQEDAEFARICERQCIPFRVVLPAREPAHPPPKARALLSKAQATHRADTQAPEELVMATCDVLLVALAAPLDARLNRLLHAHCQQGHAALIFDTVLRRKYIHCNPDQIE